MDGTQRSRNVNLLLVAVFEPTCHGTPSIPHLQMQPTLAGTQVSDATFTPGAIEWIQKRATIKN
jgi:hypothetical protein